MESENSQQGSILSLSTIIPLVLILAGIGIIVSSQFSSSKPESEIIVKVENVVQPEKKQELPPRKTVPEKPKKQLMKINYPKPPFKPDYMTVVADVEIYTNAKLKELNTWKDKCVKDINLFSQAANVILVTELPKRTTFSYDGKTVNLSVDSMDEEFQEYVYHAYYTLSRYRGFFANMYQALMNEKAKKLVSQGGRDFSVQGDFGQRALDQLEQMEVHFKKWQALGKSISEKWFKYIDEKSKADRKIIELKNKGINFTLVK